MKWPKINRQSLRTVRVPKLSGGVNMRDSVTLVEDNQLTDCLNMWYKDGVLKTRPGLYTDGFTMRYYTPCKDSKCSGKPLDIFMNKYNKLYRLYQYEVSGVQNGDEHQTPVSFNGVFWASKEDIISLPQIQEPISFVTQFKNKIYVYTQNHSIFNMEIGTNEQVWTRLTDLDFYVPLVATNCKTAGNDNLEYELKYKGNYGGVMVEGYNLISPFYRMQYSTVNKDLLNDAKVSSHAMIYNLIHSIDKPEYAGMILTAILTDAAGNKHTHQIMLDGSSYQIEIEKQDDNYYMGQCGNAIFFSKDAPREYLKEQVASIYKDSYVENNLEIIAPCFSLLECGANSRKVFGMRQAVWFGSDAEGLSSGTRLFLCGNEANEDDKSLVLWSGLNEPTYFSENCYTYVGDTTQKANAFGKQNDSLIIFKDRETFYTRYASNSDITAEDLINQNVVDYTASSVYFPMIQLHSAIGCDCPNTVQLCRNRLVWANSDGNVYTLMTQNQFSERNIYCVSDMIKRSLKENDLKKGYSADFDGHYFLFVNGNVYVMDYESYGYINASGYNKNEDAQLRIPWWIWSVPFSKGNQAILGEEYAADCSQMGGFVIGNNLCCMFYHATYGAFDNYVFKEELHKDIYINDSSSKSINSMITTKIFDFGVPHNVKDISLVNINFGDNKGDPIKVGFVSEKGVEDKGYITVCENSGGEYSPDYIHNSQFRVNNRFVDRLGIKVECKGKLSIDSISIDYKVLGGSK